MQLFESERQALGLPPEMQTSEREQPWSAQSQALNWNQAAADQWSAHQAQLRAEPEPQELVREAALRYSRNDATGPDRWNQPFRSWLGAQPEFRRWLPAELDKAHKLVWGRTPQEEEEEQMQQRAAQQAAIAARMRAFEGASGYNPLQGVTGYDPRTQTTKIPGRMVKNPRAEFDTTAEPYIQGPEMSYVMPQGVYENLLPMASELGFNPMQKSPLNVAVPVPEISQFNAGRGNTGMGDSFPSQQSFRNIKDLEPMQEIPAFREGQTATNPKTGQRLVYRQGQWHPL